MPIGCRQYNDLTLTDHEVRAAGVFATFTLEAHGAETYYTLTALLTPDGAWEGIHVRDVDSAQAARIVRWFADEDTRYVEHKLYARYHDDCADRCAL